MKVSSEAREGRQKTIGASAAGAGGGTLLIVLANSISVESPWRSVLLYAAPSASVLFSILWLWLKVAVANYVQDLQIRSLARRAKETLDQALSNPNTSSKHKEAMRARMEELEVFLADRHMGRIRSTKLITVADVVEAEKTASKTE